MRQSTVVSHASYAIDLIRSERTNHQLAHVIIVAVAVAPGRRRRIASHDTYVWRPIRVLSRARRVSIIRHRTARVATRVLKCRDA